MLYSRSRTRHRLARKLSWLVVASITSIALFAPGATSSALALTGAIYTSNFDGSIINENVNYDAKTDVYLTGGPCDGGSHLADGDYYYEVTSPNGVAALVRRDRRAQRSPSRAGSSCPRPATSPTP